MKLEPLTLEQCQQVRIWRNAEMECWRTPFMLTKEMQGDFYQKRCCDRNSPHRYWAIVRTIMDEIKGVVPETGFIGMGGITYIQWENRIGEITLIIVLLLQSRLGILEENYRKTQRAHDYDI